MSSRHRYEVVIIGGGPAGLCAALYAGRGMLKTVLLERGVPGGELLNTEWIEDYPDDPRGSSCLVLGQVHERGAVHALWGFDAPSRHAILITVYVPDPHRWSEDLRKRRSRDAGDA